MTQEYGAIRPRDPQPEEPQQEAAGAGIECPECGVLLEDMNHRRKHAEFHYPDEVFPPFPNYDLAAERKALLLDVDPKTLRGTPRRRF